MAENSFLPENAPIAARLRNCSDLPSPPSVAERIIQLGQDPSANLDDVVTTVKTDPALAARLLRMANSPLYARQRKIDNLRQALMLFGLNGTLTLALSFSLVGSLRAGTGAGLDYNLFWRRSIGVAAAAQSLGARLQLGSREELFLAGLLQDIGMLALDKALPDLYGRLDGDQQHHERLVAYEQGAVGIDHGAAGAWLLQYWNLPETVCYAAAASHGAEELPVPQEYRPLADCIDLATAVADVWLRDDYEQAVETAAERAERRLQIDRDKLQEMLESVKQSLLETGDLFDIDLGDAERMERILSQAKEVLLMRNMLTIQEAQDLRSKTDVLTTRTKILEEQVNRDALTGVSSRQYLDQLLDEEFIAARHHDWPLAVAFVDIDHFKRVNDRYGHQTGDRVLREIGQRLIGLLRDVDALGRYGGEEFVVVLPGTDLTGAKVVCERILGACREMRHPATDGQSIAVTVSIGLAVLGDPLSFDDRRELLQAADQALYDAKSQGRDRLVSYEPLMI